MVWIIITAIFIAIFYLLVRNSDSTQKPSNSQNAIINSADFQEAIKKAKVIKSIFQKAASKGEGFLRIETDITGNYNNYYSISYDRDPFIYFRLYLEYGATAYLTTMKDFNDQATIENLTNKYLYEVFDKTSEEMIEAGVDIEEIINNTKIEGPTESLLFYRFPCPCGLKGSDRQIFIDKLNEN